MKDYAHRYQKLGGWLLFVVIMTFLDAFTSFTQQFAKDGLLRTLGNYEGGELWFRLLMLFCVFYMIAMKTTYGVMIVKRDPRFVRTWQLVYAGSLINATATLVMHLLYGYPERSGPAYFSTFGYGLASDIVSFLPVPLVLFLLTLYCVKSVRVRTFMGTDKYLRLAIFGRKKPGPEPAVPDAAEEE